MQKQFLEFHNNIKLNYEDNDDLRNKRDILLKSLKDYFDISFTSFHQGSYSMHIGVKPIKGHDYDIDIGLVFKEETLQEQQIDNAFQIKEKIASYLNHYQRKVKVKEPCVTVQYTLGGDNRYHVDFAVYKEDINGYYYLARGKTAQDCSWEESHPRELTKYIVDKYPSGEVREQYRRCICYLKRWKQLKLNHKNFPSIALAIIVHDIDVIGDDVDVLLVFLAKIKKCITVKNLIFPYYPHNNLLEKLSDQQILEFLVKIDLLIEDLKRINSANDISESAACDLMRKHFGSDFPRGSSRERYINTEEFVENEYNMSNFQSIYISRKVLNYQNQDVSYLWKNQILSGRYHLRFRVENTSSFSKNTHFFWKVRNVGPEAENLDEIRGQIYDRGVEIDEHSKFAGNHYIECYAIKDNVCVGVGAINVMIGPFNG